MMMGPKKDHTECCSLTVRCPSVDGDYGCLIASQVVLGSHVPASVLRITMYNEIKEKVPLW